MNHSGLFYHNLTLFLQNRVPYHVPERVSWGRFMEAIDYKWQSECRTKVGMKKRARDYLASKIFGRAVPDNQDFCWRQLNRDNLPGHTFTFWQWFYSVLGTKVHKKSKNKTHSRIDQITIYSTSLECGNDRGFHLQTRVSTAFDSKRTRHFYASIFRLETWRNFHSLCGSK